MINETFNQKISFTVDSTLSLYSSHNKNILSSFEDCIKNLLDKDFPKILEVYFLKHYNKIIRVKYPIIFSKCSKCTLVNYHVLFFKFLLKSEEKEFKLIKFSPKWTIKNFIKYWIYFLLHNNDTNLSNFLSQNKEKSCFCFVNKNCF